uniref:Molt-inhibiting hormone n=1 Tax=Cherax quadricarinatus TaxID=27406 RepID=D0EZP2_CHEQU|nr:molt-inhibiting hormone-like [Cherax quadricarinatus]ACX55057.1 molt-inhibiting hormone [Cherax quadricarinatus]
MVKHANQSCSALRPWLIVMVVGLLVHQTTPTLTDDCPGAMGNRHIHTMLLRVCGDCYNVLRDPEIEVDCRSGCFTSDTFKSCLELIERGDEFFDFMRRVGILNAGGK